MAMGPDVGSQRRSKVKLVVDGDIYQRKVASWGECQAAVAAIVEEVHPCPTGGVPRRNFSLWYEDADRDQRAVENDKDWEQFLGSSPALRGPVPKLFARVVAAAPRMSPPRRAQPAGMPQPRAVIDVEPCAASKFRQLQLRLNHSNDQLMAFLLSPTETASAAIPRTAVENSPLQRAWSTACWTGYWSAERYGVRLFPRVSASGSSSNGAARAACEASVASCHEPTPTLPPLLSPPGALSPHPSPSQAPSPPGRWLWVADRNSWDEVRDLAAYHALLPVAARVLDQLCMRGDRERARGADHSPVFDIGDPRRFGEMRSPNDYLIRLCKYSHCSADVFMLQLILLDRIIQRGIRPSWHNIHRLLAVTLLVAAKSHDDVFYSNSYYGKICGLPVAEINNLEAKFLWFINWDVHVGANLYARFITTLKSWAQMQPRAAHSVACDLPQRGARGTSRRDLTADLSRSSFLTGEATACVFARFPRAPARDPLAPGGATQRQPPAQVRIPWARGDACGVVVVDGCAVCTRMVDALYSEVCTEEAAAAGAGGAGAGAGEVMDLHRAFLAAVRGRRWAAGVGLAAAAGKGGEPHMGDMSHADLFEQTDARSTDRLVCRLSAPLFAAVCLRRGLGVRLVKGALQRMPHADPLPHMWATVADRAHRWWVCDGASIGVQAVRTEQRRTWAAGVGWHPYRDGSGRRSLLGGTSKVTSSKGSATRAGSVRHLCGTSQGGEQGSSMHGNSARRGGGDSDADTDAGIDAGPAAPAPTLGQIHQDDIVKFREDIQGNQAGKIGKVAHVGRNGICIVHVEEEADVRSIQCHTSDIMPHAARSVAAPPPRPPQVGEDYVLARDDPSTAELTEEGPDADPSLSSDLGGF